MAKKNVVPEVVEEEVAPEVVIGSTRCLQWCFLPGISHIGPSGLLQCWLNDGHEESHQIKIEILSPPAGKFNISWTVG